MVKYDIVVTWPKTKPLWVYLEELRRAERDGLVINYRVSRLPEWPDFAPRGASWPVTRRDERRPRWYMVHDGAVRGFCEVLGATHRRIGEVDGWPAGLYIVRSPTWYSSPAPLVPMRGFQGWRWWEWPVDL